MNTSSPSAPVEQLRDTPPARRDVSRPCPPAVQPSGLSQAPAPPQRSLRVLCIDDDEQILESMKDCLAYYDHRIRVASGGKYGMELFSASILKSEPYDVVITDLSMPDVNGYAVARVIKAQSPDTPVILMTGAGATTKELGAMAVSVDAVVNKPVRMKELNALLLQVARPA